MYFALRTGFVCTPLLFLQKYKSTGITLVVDYICNYNWRESSLLIFTFVNTLPFFDKKFDFPRYSR